jgi:hypothetical protein
MYRGIQALGRRGFSQRDVPVHRHSARDHHRDDIVPWGWNDSIFPSRLFPGFRSRFRDMEKMMRDMENVLEHKYLSFPARGEESSVSTDFCKTLN